MLNPRNSTLKRAVVLLLATAFFSTSAFAECQVINGVKAISGLKMFVYKGHKDINNLNNVASWTDNIQTTINTTNQTAKNLYLSDTNRLKSYPDANKNGQRFYVGKDTRFSFTQNFFDLYPEITGDFTIYLEGNIQIPNYMLRAGGTNGTYVYDFRNSKQHVSSLKYNTSKSFDDNVKDMLKNVTTSYTLSQQNILNIFQQNIYALHSNLNGNYKILIDGQQFVCSGIDCNKDISSTEKGKDGETRSITRDILRHNHPMVPGNYKFQIAIKSSKSANSYFALAMQQSMGDSAIPNTNFYSPKTDGFCTEEPKAGVKYKIADKEFLDAFKSGGKSLDWLWGSPLRARQVGKSGQFCIIAKDENGGTSLTSGDEPVIVALKYNAKYSDESDENNPIKHETNEYDFIYGTGNLPVINVPQGGYCFDIPNMDKKLTTKAQFFIYPATNGQFNKNVITGTAVSESDTFSIRPANLSFNIYNRDQNGKLPVGNPLDKMKLIAGKTYYFSIKAMGANGTALPVKHDNQTHVAQGSFDSIRTGKYDKEYNFPFSTKKHQPDCASTAVPLNDHNKINFTNNEARTGVFSYFNLMEFGLRVLDQEWTGVDNKGTSQYGGECRRGGGAQPFNRDLVDCDIELADTLKFIPAGIKATFNGITNANNGYTYLDDFNATSSDESLKQKATLNLSIKAVAQNGTELSNFTTNCYAEPVSFTLNYSNVGDINSTDPTLRSNITAKRTRIPFIDNSPNKDQPLAKRIALATNTTGLNLDDTSTNYNEANKLRGISNGYSKFYPTENKNKMPLKAETAFFDTASTANIYINVSPRYRQNPQTPFVISSQEFFISDLKVNGSADFEKDDGTRQAYTLSNSYSQTTANINTTHDALMIQGKLYAPYYEGPSSGFDAKLYYGFYCKDCQANGTLMNDLSTTGLILNSTPEFASENLKDWFVNQAENNLDPRAYWTDQRALNTARISGIGAVNQGKQDIRLSSNKGGKDKIFIKLGDISPYLLDESNVQNGGIGENVLEVNFYGKSSNWGGRSYDKNGNKTDVGQFVIDTDNVSNRTNRRIDW
ncbi:hypothetical protein [Campylobacter gastrosuis]|uniref:Uncharacterized protein n=1 Tax=Campylobacter gastrosuis TaxID=2974576 RepID=A0ABT7HN89_9BACT|nr:hypothetical protein [Campylobacter gastrosuis]MDL0088115.1 hypothetical protein [Campylobacter gastrosuis]